MPMSSGVITRPVTVHTSVSAEVAAIASPDVASASRVNAGAPKSMSSGSVAVIDWLSDPTLMVCDWGAAAENLLSPLWVALTVQVPVVRKVISPDDSVQTDG